MLTRIRSTLPACGAVISVSIFMASRTQSTWPASISSPSSTRMRATVPDSGAVTALAEVACTEAELGTALLAPAPPPITMEPMGIDSSSCTSTSMS